MHRAGILSYDPFITTATVILINLIILDLAVTIRRLKDEIISDPTSREAKEEGTKLLKTLLNEPTSALFLKHCRKMWKDILHFILIAITFIL